MTCKTPTLKIQRGIKYIKETEEHPEKKEGDHKRMLSRKPGIQVIYCFIKKKKSAQELSLKQ